MNALDNPTAKIEKLAQTAPSLPEIVNLLDRELRKESSSPQSIEEVLNKDPALAAKLLKISNSSFYGFPSRIESISQALTMVGMAQLRELVLGTSIVRAFRGISADVVDMESFWKHSVGCGICARQIAIKREEKNVEPYFVAGLIHDIGRLVLYKNLPEKAHEAIKLAEQKRISCIDAEMEIFHFNHAELGEQILKNWKLPQRISESVRNHHKPSSVFSYFKESVNLHVADLIVNLMGIGSSGERLHTPHLPVDYALFKDERGMLKDVIEEVDEMTEEVVLLFL